MNHAPGGTRKGSLGGADMINYLAEIFPIPYLNEPHQDMEGMAMDYSPGLWDT
jgi:hypothetical protein